MELLVVIAIISILMVITVPAVINILNKSTENTMHVQEKKVAEAGLLYLEDYCKTPINSSVVCPSYISANIIDNIVYYSGRIELETLINLEYINSVVVRGTRCEGYVLIDSNDGEGYLTCGDVYTTENYSN